MTPRRPYRGAWWLQAALAGHVVATSCTSRLSDRSLAAFLELDVATATSRISHHPLLTAIASARRVRLETTR